MVLTQTPYNKSTGAFRNDYLVQRRYVQVEADVRGTGSSGGAWASFDDREQPDSFELVRWAHSRQRPWSNGDVGLWGISYAAINQIFTAAQRPHGLKAMFPIVPASDVHRDVVASGGQIDAGFIPLWLGLVTATGVIPPTYTAVGDQAGGVVTLHHSPEHPSHLVVPVRRWPIRSVDDRRRRCAAGALRRSRSGPSRHAG